MYNQIANRTKRAQLIVCLTMVSALLVVVYVPKEVSGPPPVGVVVNEFLLVPGAGGDKWLELYNREPSFVNISAWEISNSKGTAFRFPDTPQIPPGGYVVVHFSHGISDTFFGQSQNNALHLYTNSSYDNPWRKYFVDDSIGKPRKVITADLDSDGDLEILACGQSDDTVVWYDAVSSPRGDWQKHFIDQTMISPSSLVVADLDKDTHLDVLVTSLGDWNQNNAEINWFEAPDDPRDPWTKHVIDVVNDATDLDLGDIDDDGDLDIAVSSGQVDDKVWWYESPTDPMLGWTQRQVSGMMYPPDVNLADINEDGELDIVATALVGNFNLLWFEGPAWNYHIIDSIEGLHETFILDFDNDSDLDILVTGRWTDEVLLYEGPTFVKHIIDDNITAPSSVVAEDIDFDGIPEVFASGFLSNDIALYRANGSSLDDWQKTFVDVGLLGAWGLNLSNLDDDSDSELVAAGWEANQVVWYDHVGPLQALNDSIAIYSSSNHNESTIVDFVAWGSEPSNEDYDYSLLAGIWGPGEFVNVSGYVQGDTLGRDRVSTDTDAVDDFEISCGIDANVPTPGEANDRLVSLAPSNLSSILSGRGFENVTLTWDLSGDDGTGRNNIVAYSLFRNTTYSPSGYGYVLIGNVTNGTSAFDDSFAGEGNPETYFYRVCAVNSQGISSCARDQAAKFTSSLSQGPNLLSVPLVQLNESIEAVLQTVEYDQAWCYDSTSQEWKSHVTYKGYRRGLWNINHTVGVWVNVTEDSNLTVAGMVPANTSIRLHSGWNLVGFPSFKGSYDVMDMKAETGATRVEGHDAAPPYFLRVFEDAEVLQAGRGYWVKVEAHTVWTVSA